MGCTQRDSSGPGEGQSNGNASGFRGIQSRIQELCSSLKSGPFFLSLNIFRFLRFIAKCCKWSWMQSTTRQLLCGLLGVFSRNFTQKVLWGWIRDQHALQDLLVRTLLASTLLLSGEKGMGNVTDRSFERFSLNFTQKVQAILKSMCKTGKSKKVGYLLIPTGKTFYLEDGCFGVPTQQKQWSLQASDLSHSQVHQVASTLAAITVQRHVFTSNKNAWSDHKDMNKLQLLHAALVQHA